MAKFYNKEAALQKYVHLILLKTVSQSFDRADASQTVFYYFFLSVLYVSRAARVGRWWRVCAQCRDSPVCRRE